MISAMVSEVKAKLSEYLAEVRRGNVVEVRDRKTPIARLVPIEQNADTIAVDEPQRPTVDLRSIKAVRLSRRVDVVKMLAADRAQR